MAFPAQAFLVVRFPLASSRFIMNQVVDKLRGGDRRSIGRSNEVVMEVLAAPDLFSEVFDGLLSDAMRRCAGEGIVQRPAMLQPYKARLLDEAAAIPQQEVQWHVAQTCLPDRQVCGYLELNAAEKTRVAGIMESYLATSSSAIVRVMALQTLADLALHDQAFASRAVALLQEQIARGSPTVVSRGKKLLRSLEDRDVSP